MIDRSGPTLGMASFAATEFAMQLKSLNTMPPATAVAGNGLGADQDARPASDRLGKSDAPRAVEPWVSQTRAVAAIAVVLLHVAAAGVDVKDRELISTSNWEFSNCVDSSVRWCVPIVVMLSGYLLLNPEKAESISDFARKRVSRVAIPLLF